MKVHRREISVSTNLDARAGRPGDVFVAEHQTAGRGRLDHSWHSARGVNLTFSVVLSCGEMPPDEVATLPLVVGLAVVTALHGLDRRAFGGLRLKWPNDVLDGQWRKVAGILCERNGDMVIAGVGLNVNETAFPAAVAGRAVSLAMLANRQIDRDVALEAVLRAIEHWHSRWLAVGFAAIHGEFARLDCLRGRRVSVRQTDADPAPVVGECGGIAPDGSLLVDGKCVCAGEAHVEEY